MIVVVDRAAHSLVRKRLAGKRRAPGRFFSLDADLDQGCAQRRPADGGLAIVKDSVGAECRLDIEHMLGTLSSDERTLAKCLMRGNISDAAKQIGIPRTTANRWVEKIRARFEDAGLREYLP